MSQVYTPYEPTQQPSPKGPREDGLQETFLHSIDDLSIPESVVPLPDTPVELRELTQYQIVQEIGRGGMGQVFLAKDLPLDRLVVIKVVKTERMNQGTVVERFTREMRLAARLNHPNVVVAFTSHRVGDFIAFVMEYVPGEDLAKYVKSHGPLSVAKATYYISQVARGLKHAHQHGLVHRDIKPSNLILLKTGKKHSVKILDFGLAKARVENEHFNAELTGAGRMLGTPEYVAPEQIRDAAMSDIRADLYSLGCTLYYLITGEPPFRGRSEFELQESHVFKTAVPLNELRAEVPDELAAIAAKLLAKDPKDRFQTPTELLDTLTPFMKSLAVADNHPSSNPYGQLVFDDDSGIRPGNSIGKNPSGETPTKPGNSTVEIAKRTESLSATPMAMKLITAGISPAPARAVPAPKSPLRFAAAAVAVVALAAGVAFFGNARQWYPFVAGLAVGCLLAYRFRQLVPPRVKTRT